MDIPAIPKKQTHFEVLLGIDGIRVGHKKT